MSDGHLVKPVNLRELEKVLAEVRGLPPRCVGAARESSGGAVGGPAAGRLGASAACCGHGRSPRGSCSAPVRGGRVFVFSWKGPGGGPRRPRPTPPSFSPPPSA